ncbi:MAG: LuxR C-terminal-related transcriptional regulator [Myxococcota bacterium]
MVPSTPHGVLPTKIRSPRLRPGAVPRARLLDTLDRALSWQPLTLVSASAGSGKSTLVAQWLHLRSLPHGWLSLEPTDNQPLSLLRGLLAMLVAHFPELADHRAPPLNAGASALIPLFGAWLIAPLAEREERLVLVLDDVHHITDPDLLDAIGWLIERLPEQVHLVLISRVEPDLPLARLQVRGQVTVIDGQQLRFTPEESRAFYNETMSLSLTDADVRALDARTEGWAAAIQLSALSVRSGVSPLELAGPHATRQDQVLEQFLTEEVLARQPDEVRRFLLRTSILSRLNVAACVAVTGAAANVTLQHLDRENLFLIPLDGDGRWWRYHHLFSSLLRAALARSDEDIAALHRRACQWAMGAGLAQEAFRHAIAAQDADLTAAVIDTFSTALIFQGEYDVLNAWFDQVPDDLIVHHPKTGAYALWARVLGRRVTDIHSARENIEHTLAAQPDLPVPLRREILANLYAALAFALHLTPRADDALALVDLAVAHLDDPSHSLHATISYMRGTVLMNRRALHAALDAMSDAIRAAIRLNNHSLTAGATELRIRILGLMGRVAEAEENIDALLSGTKGTHNGFAVQQRGWTALYVGDFETARAMALDAIHNRTYLYSNDDISSGRALLAIALELLGETGAADVETLRATDSSQGLGPRAGRIISGVIGVHRDDVRRVQATLEAIPHAQCPSPEERFWHTWMSVWLQAREGALGEALIQARGHVARAQHDGAVVFAFIWRALEAAILDAMAAPGEAAEARAQVQASGIVLASTLRAPLPSPVPPPNITVPAPAPGVITQAGGKLSEREAEVLGLVASGMTNQAIADALFVTVSTVKTHIHRIFRKLNVRNRTEAVHHARALGWIAEDAAPMSTKG